MANSKKTLRAEAVHWLSDMKAKGNDRLRQLRKMYAAGKAAEAEVRSAEKKYQVICALLQVMQACDIDNLEDILSMLQGMRGEGGKQKTLFRQPKNPM